MKVSYTACSIIEYQPPPCRSSVSLTLAGDLSLGICRLGVITGVIRIAGCMDHYSCGSSRNASSVPRASFGAVASREEERPARIQYIYTFRANNTDNSQSRDSH